MLQRNISIETIKLLTDVLLDMAARDDLNHRWPEGLISRNDILQGHFLPAGGMAEAVSLLSEPDFVLFFRPERPRGNAALVVDLETYEDRVIRHTWTRNQLNTVAAAL